MIRKSWATGLSVIAVLICFFVVLAGAASAQVDLTEGAVTVTGSPISGKTVQVADTVTNSGPTAVTTSYTQLFLSTNGTTKGTFLGYRYTGALPSTATTTVTLPLNIAGPYFIMACANGNRSVVETNYDNNCAASAQFTVAGPNLTQAVSISSSSALSGSSIVVTDTLSNQGVVNANSSYTQIFLTNATTKIFLGYRYPAGLNAGATAAPVNTNVTLPTYVSGSYSVQVCANASRTVIESNYNDNCASAPLNVLSAANTVVVDGTKGVDGASCGGVTPCKTIGAAVTAATAGKTVLVNPGTYTEQVTVNKSISLVSATKYAAVIQAPATMVPDVNNQANIVRIGGGATAVIDGLTIQGPGPTGCGSLHSGIFVADATATISNNKILSIRDNPASGCQNGVGISVNYRHALYGGKTVTITNNIISDYQKAGIAIEGTNTANITNNVVTGLGSTNVIGQNGIELVWGAKGTVSNNIVTNNSYFIACSMNSGDANYDPMCNAAGTVLGPKNPQSTGILLYSVNGGVSILNNTVSGNDIGVSTAGGAMNVLVKGNTVNNNRAAGIANDFTSSLNMFYANIAQFNGKDGAGNIVGFIDNSFPLGYGYDLIDENPAGVNDWGYTQPGAVPNTFNTNWGGSLGPLFN